MPRSTIGLTLLSSALVLGGCAGAAPPAPGEGAPPDRRPDRIDADRVPPTAPRPERDEALAAALQRALEDPGEWPALRVFTECRRDAGLESIEILGNGVAIWDERRQFEVSEAEIAALLAAFRRADFAAMPDTFGGKTAPREVPPPPAEGAAIAALRVICRVELSVGGVTKRVAQLDEGEQSEALKELSEELFRVCAEPARTAVGATDLADGLAKIARGELAPETLDLMLHRKPEGRDPAPPDGFLLRLDGMVATSSLVAPAGGPGAARALALSPAELRKIAGELAGRDLEELPVNLYAPVYTDFSISVLDRKRSVQARRFDGMEPATHGDLQRRFDGVFELLVELHRRVIAEGSPVSE